MKVKRYFLEFEDPTENSDKFYQVFVTERGTLFNYGRRGTDGQEKWVPAPNFEHAEIHASKKVYEKLDKGYMAAYEPVVFEAPDSAESLGDLAWAMRRARRDGSIADASDDLASKAEDFASRVAELIASVKRGDEASEILTSIQKMQEDLERVDNAIENARLGLQMARESLRRSVEN